MVFALADFDQDIENLLIELGIAYLVRTFIAAVLTDSVLIHLLTSN